jgi:hypothetical protein
MARFADFTGTTLNCYGLCNSRIFPLCAKIAPMSIEPENTDLRLSLEVDRGAAGMQRISVRVEGQGALAAQTARRIGDVFERAAAEALRASSLPFVPAPLERTPPAAAEVERPADLIAPAAVQEPAGVVFEAAERAAPAAVKAARDASTEAAAAPRSTPWFRRWRVRISGGIGIFLFALAVIVPLIVPPEMRREILPMPIAFGLIGALSLFSAMLPDPAPKRAATAAPEVTSPVRRARALPASAPASGTRRLFGVGLGGLFAVGGLTAPFLLAGSSADDRFLMMLGFAPIAAIGAFLIWVFTRRPTTVPAHPVRRAALARAQPCATKMTGALTALAVMLGVIVALVILATLIQAL